jgi:hypothetical protein
LYFEWHIADFVEEHSAPIGLLKFSLPTFFIRTRERSWLVTKELRSDKMAGNAAALTFTIALCVADLIDGRHEPQLFASSAFATDSTGISSGADFDNLSAKPAHRRTSSY